MDKENWVFQENEMSKNEKEMLMMVLPRHNIPRDERWIDGIKYRTGADGVTYCDITDWVRTMGLVEPYLEKAFPYYPPPKLDDMFLDIHSRRVFTVKDCLFIVYAERVMAMSPDFYRSGGTVLDWVDPNTVLDEEFVSIGIVKRQTKGEN